MPNLTKIGVAAATMIICLNAYAQSERYDVFLPIGKYLVKGDVECLSAWFDDNLEVSVPNADNTVSKSQAKQIVKAFFDSYTPQSFDISHTAEKANMKYALGNMTAGGENFTVTIFVSSKGERYKIQQLKIERL